MTDILVELYSRAQLNHGCVGCGIMSKSRMHEAAQTESTKAPLGSNNCPNCIRGDAYVAHN